MWTIVQVLEYKDNRFLLVDQGSLTFIKEKLVNDTIKSAQHGTWWKVSLQVTVSQHNNSSRNESIEFHSMDVISLYGWAICVCFKNCLLRDTQVISFFFYN